MIPESWSIGLAWVDGFDLLTFSGGFLRIALWILLWLGPQLAVGCVAFALFSLPMRRRERAALFLDLIETGLQEGITPEQTMVRSAACQDRSLGVRFHLAAAHLESGSTLPEALERVPRFLPPQIAAMFKAGLSTLGLERLLPACRAVLKDGLSQNHSALNWHSLIFFFLSPLQLGILVVLIVFVLPKFQEIMRDMLSSDTGAAPETMFGTLLFHQAWIPVTFMLASYLVLLGVFLAITGGARLAGWLRAVFGLAWDRWVLRIPWRRMRLQRDFITMLALHLDAALPEEQAVTLAASATDNRAIIALAGRVVLGLRQGVPLPQALSSLNRLPELQWRLLNVFQGGGRFQDAVAGWCQSLEARAFQQEQTAAHLVTTGLVLVNGVVVGSIVIGIFSMLISIINQGILW